MANQIESQKNCIYIAGPMSGYPELNKLVFEEATNHFRKKGFDVVNPHEINQGLDHKTERRARLINDFSELVKCTHIHMLPGWNQSPTAITEFIVACSMELIWISDYDTPPLQLAKDLSLTLLESINQALHHVPLEMFFQKAE